MNKLENAVSDANGSLVIRVYKDEAQNIVKLDKTWKEIHDAMLSGFDCILTCEDTIILSYQQCIYPFTTRMVGVSIRDNSQIPWEGSNEVVYMVNRYPLGGYDTTYSFYASSETDYPANQIPEQSPDEDASPSE